MDDRSALRHSAALLALVTRALASVNAGVDPRPQICHDLGALTGADSSAYVMRSASGELHLTSSESAPDRELVEQALALLGPDVRPIRFLRHGLEGTGRDGACVPLSVDQARTTALVLAGDLPSTAVLEQTGGALREVDGVLARFSLSRPPVPEQRRTRSAGLLTARELDVLRLLAEGLMARTIAVRLDLSPRTVHHHLGNIYGKLGVGDRLAAVLRAREFGLLSDRSRTALGSPRRLAAALPARSS